MRTIIHDLSEKEVKKLNFNKGDKIVSALECTKNCVGCFSCWTKHPKKCAINDSFSNLTDYIKKSDELILISKNRYGCYSSEVKRALERCIGYVLPYFCIRNNEIHHCSRYDKQIKMTSYFYGEMDEEDKENAKNLLRANAVNLNAGDYEIKYIKNIKEISNCIH